MEPEPVFPKKLKDTDFNNRFSFPSEHLGILPQVAGAPYDSVDFQVRCGDEVRTFHCIKRRNGCQKPVIQRGCPDLVQDRGVQIGDELELYVEASNDRATHYRIEVYRYKPCYDDEMGKLIISVALSDKY